MYKPKVLLLGKIDHAIASWNSLGEVAEIVTAQAKNRTEFIEECRSGRFDGVVVICDRAPFSLITTGKYDEELIQALPKSLEFICHNGAGYDNIDVSARTACSILVSNCPNVVDDATADTAMFLILAALRGFNNGIMAIRNGTWKGAVPPPPLGHDPQGKVLGILGMGGIGRNLKKKAEVFGMNIIYHNRKRLDAEQADGADPVPKHNVTERDITTPEMSYGCQKVICETFINDYTRRGMINGFSLRFPTISIRPGTPSKAISAFLSGIIREPMNGQECIVPLKDRAWRHWMSSPKTLVHNILVALTIPQDALPPHRRVLNMPGFAVTIQDMLYALEEVGGKDKLIFVREEEVPSLKSTLYSWADDFDNSLALSLAMKQDTSFVNSVRDYVRTLAEDKQYQ